MNDFKTEKTVQEDAEIIRKVRQGDKSEYVKLVDRYQNRLRSVLSFYCHSKDEIEEFTQEAFVEAYTHIDQFRPGSPFFPWLRAIAVNALLMMLRDRKTEKRLGSEYLQRLQMSQVKQEKSEKREEERLAALDSCVEKLSEKNAQLIRQKYQNEHSYKHMAEIFNSKENALRVRLMRIRESLRQCIEKFIDNVEGQKI